MKKDFINLAGLLAKDDTFSAEFSKLSSIDKKYQLALSKGGNYSKEEFIGFLNDLEKAYNLRGELPQESLEKVAGGTGGNLRTKVAATAMLTLTMGNVLPGTANISNQAYANPGDSENESYSYFTSASGNKIFKQKIGPITAIRRKRGDEIKLDDVEKLSNKFITEKIRNNDAGYKKVLKDTGLKNDIMEICGSIKNVNGRYYLNWNGNLSSPFDKNKINNINVMMEIYKRLCKDIGIIYEKEYEELRKEAATAISNRWKERKEEEKKENEAKEELKKLKEEKRRKDAALVILKRWRERKEEEKKEKEAKEELEHLKEEKRRKNAALFIADKWLLSKKEEEAKKELNELKRQHLEQEQMQREEEELRAREARRKKKKGLKEKKKRKKAAEFIADNWLLYKKEEEAKKELERLKEEKRFKEEEKENETNKRQRHRDRKEKKEKEREDIKRLKEEEKLEELNRLKEKDNKEKDNTVYETNYKKYDDSDRINKKGRKKKNGTHKIQGKNNDQDQEQQKIYETETILSNNSDNKEIDYNGWNFAEEENDDLEALLATNNANNSHEEGYNESDYNLRGEEGTEENDIRNNYLSEVSSSSSSSSIYDDDKASSSEEGSFESSSEESSASISDSDFLNKARQANTKELKEINRIDRGLRKIKKDRIRRRSLDEDKELYILSKKELYTISEENEKEKSEQSSSSSSSPNSSRSSSGEESKIKSAGMNKYWWTLWLMKGNKLQITLKKGYEELILSYDLFIKIIEQNNLDIEKINEIEVTNGGRLVVPDIKVQFKEFKKVSESTIKKIF